MTDALAGQDDWRALDFLIRGFQVSRIIRVAADLGLADRIAADSERPAAELAAECEVHAGQLLRVLRALAAFGIFRVSADGSVAHTPRSLLLRTDAERSLGIAARFWTGRGSWRGWEHLDEALVGRVPHEVAWGLGRFDYLVQHPDEARIFDDFMARSPGDRHGAVAAAYDFSAARLIVDVGGGNGELLRRILARFPGARGIVAERADVIAAIPDSARAGGRIEVAVGDLFSPPPPGADHYLLAHILHDWPDEDCLRMLGAIRAAMPPDALLLVLESLLEADPEKGAPGTYLVDMQMMAMFGHARERTEAEMRRLLTTAGFTPLDRTDTTSPVSILSARPAA